MKTIIVPTDFSSCALDAARYALEIARESNADLYFVHCTFLPIVTPYDQLTGPMDVTGLEQEGMRQLEHFLKQIPIDPAKESFQVKLDSRLGTLKDEILSAAEKTDAALIVMGTHGTSGLFDRLLGSNASNLVASSRFPVLVVPEGAVMKGLENVVLATDYQTIPGAHLLTPLVDLARMFGSELHVVTIKTAASYEPDDDQVVGEVNFDEVFQDIPHHFRVIHDQDVVKAIEQYARYKKADLLVGIPHKHGFFASLLHRSISRELIHYAKRPMLLLPG